MSRLRYYIVLSLLSTSCTANEESKEEIEEREDCQVKIDGKSLFVGTEECLKRLPPRRLSGIWVLGHEYSVFYEGNVSDISQRSYEDTWLQANPSEILPEFGSSFDGKTHAYRVEFVGTLADFPGVYGHWGQYKRGAFVLEMLSLQPLADSVALNKPHGRSGQTKPQGLR